jgi:hypothetical protein
MARIAIHMSDKVDFKLKSMRREQWSLHSNKRKIHQEEISILNICAPNTGALIYILKMALRAQIEANTVIGGDLNTLLLPIDRSSRQKINKETSELLHTSDQMVMVDIYRVFHPKIKQHKFFSAVHGAFSKIDDILGHIGGLNKFTKIEITPVSYQIMMG